MKNKIFNTFKSNDHIRFENGCDISGHNENCIREIVISPLDIGSKKYKVKILSLDRFPIEETMSEKQMQVFAEDDFKIELRGYGSDIFGFPFSNYGITLNYFNNEIDTVILHMFNRNTDIHYFFDKKLQQDDLSLSERVNEGLEAFENLNYSLGKEIGKEIYDILIKNIEYFDKFSESNMTELGAIEMLIFNTAIPDGIGSFPWKQTPEELNEIGKKSNIDKKLILFAMYIESIYYDIRNSYAVINQRQIRLMEVYQGITKEFLLDSVISSIGENKIFKTSSKEELVDILFELLINFLTYYTVEKNEKEFSEKYEDKLIKPLNKDERMYDRREIARNHFGLSLSGLFKK